MQSIRVQEELARRSNGKTRYSGISLFSHKIKCIDCGSWYGSKVWHSTDRYKKTIYRCNSKYDGQKCQTPHVTEEEIKTAFISAFNKLLSEKKEIIANIEQVRIMLDDTGALKEEKLKLEDEINVLVEMSNNLIAENARVAQNQDDYRKRYEDLIKRYDEAKARFDELAELIFGKEIQGKRLVDFIEMLRGQKGLITEFDKGLWSGMVDFVTVGKDKKISVTFRNGVEIEA